MLNISWYSFFHHCFILCTMLAVLISIKDCLRACFLCLALFLPGPDPMLVTVLRVCLLLAASIRSLFSSPWAHIDNKYYLRKNPYTFQAFFHYSFRVVGLLFRIMLRQGLDIDPIGDKPLWVHGLWTQFGISICSWYWAML